MNLSLYTSACISTCQCFNFFYRYQIEVSIDSMLQSRSSYGKFKSRTLVRLRQQTVDDTTGKRVTTTYTVDDRIDIVTFRFVEFFTVINHCLPAIMTCRE